MSHLRSFPHTPLNSYNIHVWTVGVGGLFAVTHLFKVNCASNVQCCDNSFFVTLLARTACTKSNSGLLVPRFLFTSDHNFQGSLQGDQEFCSFTQGQAHLQLQAIAVLYQCTVKRLETMHSMLTCNTNRGHLPHNPGSVSAAARTSLPQTQH